MPQQGTAKSQAQKFKEAAKELSCDENEEAFDAALKKIGTAKASKDKKQS